MTVSSSSLSLIGLSDFELPLFVSSSAPLSETGFFAPREDFEAMDLVSESFDLSDVRSEVSVFSAVSFADFRFQIPDRDGLEPDTHPLKLSIVQIKNAVEARGKTVDRSILYLLFTANFLI